LIQIGELVALARTSRGKFPWKICWSPGSILSRKNKGKAPH
jgi:hypothetical protein